MKEVFEGLPVWKEISNVVEIDKKFFFLDDDNNYEPNLFHHGL
jgi:hypothetical protein